MLVKYEPIQDRKRHEFKAKKSTQNLPSKWVKKHKFLIQRHSCLSGVPAIHAVQLREWKCWKNGVAGNKYCRLGSVTSFRSRRLRKAIMFISSLTAIQQNSVNLITQHSVGRVASEWCRLEGMKLTWELKAPLNVGWGGLRDPRMHRSSAHQLQGANRGNGWS